MELKPSYTTTSNLMKTSLLTVPMLFLVFIFLRWGIPKFDGVADTAAFLITFIFFNSLFFLILYTGKTNRYRSIGFIVLALFFTLTFIVKMVGTRGSMSFSYDNFIECEIPFCHIVTTMIIIPAVFTKTIIFPGSIVGGYAAIAPMLITVIAMSVALGRAFCSWGCFFGGWDDGASSILRKRIIKKVNPVFKWMPFAILLIIAIWAAAIMNPVYCDWLCPFKTVSEYQEITSVETFFKTMVFVLLFAGLVIILPLLTKKRIQCATFCPMGALLSCTNKINIFDVRIDKEKCSNCKLCVVKCPTFSISGTDIEKGRPIFTCTKCGKCIDACTKRAIHYHIKGTPVNKNHTLYRTMFLFPSFSLLVMIAGGMIQNGILIIIKLISTGSFI